MREKIAIVVQRYGLEVNGGSEYSCRLLSEKLSTYYDVEVLTTKALDYMTWENHYSQQEEIINGVKVKRFQTDNPRNVKEFNKKSELVLGESKHTVYDELEWMKLQGPVSFELLEYIKANKDKYKTFIFFTYTYFTTYFGLQLVPEKSVLVPTTHDEPHVYLSIYKPFFHLPRHFIFLTDEEKEFVHSFFKNDYIPYTVAGIGVDIPNSFLTEEDFRNQYNIRDPYIIYVGRIDESKGCKELFEYFIRYKEQYPSKLKLILMGKPVMDIPKHQDIISLGFVSEEEKAAGVTYSSCLIMPSLYESLSMVVLESLSLGTPVLVNEKCEVLKGHCEKGNAGLYFEDYNTFSKCLDFLLTNKKVSNSLAENGYHYVNDLFNWDTILDKYKHLISTI
jgi:glycosyltransferase involved in cell wall biosynthesis